MRRPTFPRGEGHALPGDGSELAPEDSCGSARLEFGEASLDPRCLLHQLLHSPMERHGNYPVGCQLEIEKPALISRMTASAERVGFEPTKACTLPAFQASAISRTRRPLRTQR